MLGRARGAWRSAADGITFAYKPENVAGALRGMRVLLVEDGADIRDVFTVLLNAEGAEAMTAATGYDAIQLAARHRFDIVLTDLGLPDVPGDTVIRRVIATAGRRPWIVVMTGYGEPFVGRAREAGADIILTKPMIWEWVLDRLVTLAGGQRAA